MTKLDEVYQAWLGRFTSDEWETLQYSEEEMLEDFRTFLDMAIALFKFPKKSLEYDENGFIETLDNREKQILASYMKCEWLNRLILDYNNIIPLYDERDFSPANYLKQLDALLREERKQAEKLEEIYYRVDNNKPFDYSFLAGDDDV